MTRWERLHFFDRLAQRERDRQRLLRRRPDPAPPTPAPRELWWRPVQGVQWVETPTYSVNTNATTTWALHGVWDEDWNETSNGSSHVYRVQVQRYVITDEWRSNGREWQQLMRRPEPRIRPEPLYPTRTPEQVRIIGERADRLLQEVLSDEQRRVFARRGFIPTVGQVTRLEYRVYMGRQHNIRIMDGDREAWDMCVHVADSVPDADNVAAQVLGLQYNEEMMLRTANLNRLRRGAADPRDLLQRVA